MRGRLRGLHWERPEEDKWEAGFVLHLGGGPLPEPALNAAERTGLFPLPELPRETSPAGFSGRLVFG